MAIQTHELLLCVVFNIFCQRNSSSSDLGFTNLSRWRFQTFFIFNPGEDSHDYIQGSLNYPFWGNQTMRIYVNFVGFPGYNSALFGLVI